MKLNLLEVARDLAPELVTLRRDLHRHPELGFEERRTAGIAAEHMRALGLTVRTEVGRTGVVADLDNGDGPRVAIRADMDALPIQEEGDHDYRSEVPGVMHACGHDAHTTALIGAARILVKAHAGGELPPGRLRFLFQPSEERTDAEGKSGAMRMIDEGALEAVDAVTGLHVGGHAPSGTIFVSEGSVMAGSEEIVVTVRGQSAHAAMPERGVDALVLAAQGVLACQQAVSRRISPMQSGVLSFGAIEGGTAGNVIADRVRLKGTLRYFDREVRGAIVDALQASFGMLEAHGAKVEIEVGPGYIPLVNDPAVTRLVADALGQLAGEDAVLPMSRLMAAEDFAYMAREVPGCFFWLGAALENPREHHTPTFDIDEGVLPLASAALARAAFTLLEDLDSAGEAPGSGL